MPNKIRTGTQFARLLGATPLQVELTLVKMTNHVARNTPNEHIISFYRDWEDIRADRFDGFIVTGAPVETMPFGTLIGAPSFAGMDDETDSWTHRDEIFARTRETGRAPCRARVCQYV